jgi:hypothetical protein
MLVNRSHFHCFWRQLLTMIHWRKQRLVKRCVLRRRAWSQSGRVMYASPVHLIHAEAHEKQCKGANWGKSNFHRPETNSHVCVVVCSKSLPIRKISLQSIWRSLSGNCVKRFYDMNNFMRKRQKLKMNFSKNDTKDNDIPQYPTYVTLKMQCGIAFLVKFIIWSIIEKDCDSNIWVLS